MNVLIWVVVIGIGVGIFAIQNAFDNHCEAKFGHRFFTKKILIFNTAIVSLAVYGCEWASEALSTNGDTLDPTVLMLLSMCLAVALVIYHIRRTNFLYGFIASTVQLGFLGCFSFISLPILYTLGILYIAWLATAQRVRVI